MADRPRTSRFDFLGAPLRKQARVEKVDDSSESEKNAIERILLDYAEPLHDSSHKRKRDADDDDDEDRDDKKVDDNDVNTGANIIPVSFLQKRKRDNDGSIDRLGAQTSALSQLKKRTRDSEQTDDRSLVPISTSTTTVGALSKRRATPAAIQHKRQPNMLSMQSFMLDLLKADAEEEADKLRNTRVHLKWEYEVMNLRFRGEAVGDIRIRRRSEALDCLYENMPPSKQQRLMHLGGEALSYVSYYGDELNAHMVRILRQKKWSEFRTEGVFTAPRRFGKTVAESMEAAAELVTQPGNSSSEYGHDVLVYSNNHRASKMLLLQTYKFVKLLCSDAKFGGYIEGINKNESIIFVTREGFINTMYAYPAKPDNLRGTGSKCPTGTVIAEEFAYMPEEVFFGILAPTLTRRNVKFIGITTVNGSDSFVSPLTTAKYPDGRSVFLVLDFQLICAECKAAHREAQCKCLLGDLPHWQSSVQHEKLSIIMERKIGKFLQEIKGLNVDETVSPAFCQVSCEFLRTPESVMSATEIYSDTVYCAVDPACGGKYSKFAIVSAIFRDNLMIVSLLFVCQSVFISCGGVFSVLVLSLECCSSTPSSSSSSSSPSSSTLV
jgi:hypothetical protein